MAREILTNILLNLSYVLAQSEMVRVGVIQNTIPPLRSLPVKRRDILKLPHYERENVMKPSARKNISGCRKQENFLESVPFELCIIKV